MPKSSKRGENVSLCIIYTQTVSTDFSPRFIADLESSRWNAWTSTVPAIWFTMQPLSLPDPTNCLWFSTSRLDLAARRVIRKSSKTKSAVLRYWGQAPLSMPEPHAQVKTSTLYQFCQIFLIANLIISSLLHITNFGFKPTAHTRSISSTRTTYTSQHLNKRYTSLPRVNPAPRNRKALQTLLLRILVSDCHYVRFLIYCFERDLWMKFFGFWVGKLVQN